MSGSEYVEITVDGAKVRVARGASAAAAMLTAGTVRFRKSVAGEARAPLCGMGICFECRVTIDGRPHVRSCMVACMDGMDVRTDD